MNIRAENNRDSREVERVDCRFRGRYSILGSRVVVWKVVAKGKLTIKYSQEGILVTFSV
jgi:hypothetical protein